LPYTCPVFGAGTDSANASEQPNKEIKNSKTYVRKILATIKFFPKKRSITDIFYTKSEYTCFRSVDGSKNN